MIALDATSLVTNSIAKTSFATGKFGIGPYALNNNSHVLTILYNVTFKATERGDSILEALDLMSLGRTTDDYGESILSWISGLINVHVDVAKDPIVDTLCLNQYTYNLSNLLIRTGYGEPTFYFLAQPAMKELYAEYKIASGVYGQDVGTSVSTRTEAAVTSVFSKYVQKILGKSETASQYRNSAMQQLEVYFCKKYGNTGSSPVQVVNNYIKMLMRGEAGKQILYNFSTTPEEDIAKGDTKYSIYDRKIGGALADTRFDLTYDEIQALVLYANLKLQEKAKYLSNLVQFTKIDTKKQGKTLIEQRAYLNGYLNLTKEAQFNLNGMLDETYIGQKTEPVIQLTSKLLSSQLLQATGGYDIILNTLLSSLEQDRTDTTFTEKMHNMIMARLRSDFFFKGANSYCRERDINPVALLLSKKSSIYMKLMAIKSEMYKGGKYGDLVNNDNECYNYLLRNLFTSEIVKAASDANANSGLNSKYTSAMFIARLNSVIERTNEVDMKTAWRDLLNDTLHPELQRFAEELIVYSFITSVTASGANSLFQYVPEDWMIGETAVTSATQYKGKTYGQYFYDKVESWNKVDGSNITEADKEMFLFEHGFSSNEIDQLVTNFAADPTLVPEITIKDEWVNDRTLRAGTDIAEI